MKYIDTFTVLLWMRCRKIISKRLFYLLNNWIFPVSCSINNSLLKNKYLSIYTKFHDFISERSSQINFRIPQFVLHLINEYLILSYIASFIERFLKYTNRLFSLKHFSRNKVKKSEKNILNLFNKMVQRISFLLKERDKIPKYRKNNDRINVEISFSRKYFSWRN